MRSTFAFLLMCFLLAAQAAAEHPGERKGLGNNVTVMGRVVYYTTVNASAPIEVAAHQSSATAPAPTDPV